MACPICAQPSPAERQGTETSRFEPLGAPRVARGIRRQSQREPGATQPRPPIRKARAPDARDSARDILTNSWRSPPSAAQAGARAAGPAPPPAAEPRRLAPRQERGGRLRDHGRSGATAYRRAPRSASPPPDRAARPQTPPEGGELGVALRLGKLGERLGPDRLHLALFKPGLELPVAVPKQSGNSGGWPDMRESIDGEGWPEKTKMGSLRRIPDRRLRSDSRCNIILI